MTVRVVEYTVRGTMRVREADDDNHAADVVEAAVRRAAEPFREHGADVQADSFHYARESITQEPG